MYASQMQNVTAGRFGTGEEHMIRLLLKSKDSDIGLLFMPDRFPESGTKNAPEYECLHEAWRASQ